MTGDEQTRFPFDDGPQTSGEPDIAAASRDGSAGEGEVGEQRAAGARAAGADTVLGARPTRVRDDRLAGAVARSRAIDHEAGVVPGSDAVQGTGPLQRGGRAAATAPRAAGDGGFARPVSARDAAGDPTIAMDRGRLAASAAGSAPAVGSSRAAGSTPAGEDELARLAERHRLDEDLEGVDDRVDDVRGGAAAAAPAAPERPDDDRADEGAARATLADALRAEAVAGRGAGLSGRVSADGTPIAVAAAGTAAADAGAADAGAASGMAAADAGPAAGRDARAAASRDGAEAPASTGRDLDADGDGAGRAEALERGGDDARRAGAARAGDAAAEEHIVGDRLDDEPRADVAATDADPELDGAGAAAATAAPSRRTVEIDRTADRDTFAAIGVDDEDAELVKPAKRGNRGVGVIMAILSTLAFAVAFALGVPLMRRLVEGRVDVLGAAMDFAPSAAFWLPVTVVGIVGIIWALIVNRAGWWSYIIGGLLVGLTAALAVPLGALVQDAVNAGDWSPVAGSAYLGRVRDGANLAPMLLAFILGRELFTWIGGIAAARGRRLARRHRRELEEYDRALVARERDRVADRRPATAGTAGIDEER